ncbi:MAG: molybdopterin converting factor subunit 1 [Phycisphaerales bacterium]|nr:molybdopterin converting factor subunit 1 [Phycisphaerales bacterium]
MTDEATITVTVQYFAVLAERIGAREETIDIPRGATVQAALAAVSDRHPAVRDMSGSLAIAVNNAYAPPTRMIKPDDVIAVIPPVSGG